MINWFNKTLSIGDLMSIDKARIKRASKLRVEFVETINIEKEQTILDKLINFFRGKPKVIFYKIVKYKVYSNSGNKYTVLFKISPGFDKRQFLKNKVQVFCSCSDFMYRAAYELNKHNNLLKIPVTEKHLKNAISDPPVRVSTTPACKHVYACLSHLEMNLKQLKLIY